MDCNPVRMGGPPCLSGWDIQWENYRTKFVRKRWSRHEANQFSDPPFNIAHIYGGEVPNSCSMCQSWNFCVVYSLRRITFLLMESRRVEVGGVALPQEDLICLRSDYLYI